MKYLPHNLRKAGVATEKIAQAEFQDGDDLCSHPGRFHTRLMLLDQNCFLSAMEIWTTV